MKPDDEARPTSRALIVLLVGPFLMPAWSFVGWCITPAGARMMANGQDWFWLLFGLVMLLSFGACAVAPMWISKHLGKKILLVALGVGAWIFSLGFSTLLQAAFGYVDFPN